MKAKPIPFCWLGSEPKVSRIVAIDPGSSSGALVTGRYHPEHEPVYTADNLADSIRGLWDQLFVLSKITPVSGFLLPQNTDDATLWVVEQVGGSMPGNSARSSRTFAEHVGALRMATVALGVKATWWVLPRRWMGDLFDDGSLPHGMENRGARKVAIYEAMMRRYPAARFTFTKRQADAVGILSWAEDRLRREGVLNDAA